MTSIDKEKQLPRDMDRDAGNMNHGTIGGDIEMPGNAPSVEKQEETEQTNEKPD